MPLYDKVSVKKYREEIKINKQFIEYFPPMALGKLQEFDYF